MKKILFLFLLIIIITILSGCTFVGYDNIYNYNEPGFFSGIWHGLIAPYTLIVRWFADIYMYADPNSGWFYDFGFLLGIVFSLPIGWLAAIISIILLMLS